MQEYLSVHLKELPARIDGAYRKIETVVQQLEYFENNWSSDPIDLTEKRKREILVQNLSTYFKGYDQTAKDQSVKYLTDALQALRRVN